MPHAQQLLFATDTHVAPLLAPDFFDEAEQADLIFQLPDMPELPPRLRNQIFSGKEMKELLHLAFHIRYDAATVHDMLNAMPVHSAGIMLVEQKAENDDLLSLALIIALSEAVILDS